MAQNMTSYLEQKLLDHTLNIQEYSFPTVHLALLTQDPGEAGSLVSEITEPSYSRVALAGKFVAATSSTSSNAVDIEFPQSLEDWGTVTHIGVMDAATEGNMLYHGPLDAPRLIDPGTVVRLPVGNMALTLS